nr:MAG TPA: RecT protein [Caudoviricetes sp.]
MATQAAEMLASSSMVPAAYQNNPGSCFIAINTALRLRMDPLMVMQNLYVVHGTPSWSGKFAIALIQTCGKFTGIKFEERRAGERLVEMRLVATKKETGEECRGVWVTEEMAKKEKWLEKNGSKWATMPELMYRYRAAAFFARTECPEVLNGLSVEGEAEDIAGKSQPDIKPPLFKSREISGGDVVDAEKVADSPRLPVAAKIPGKSDAEIPPPHIRLMEALSCTEEELNAAVEKASKGKFHSFFELNASQQEKLAANPDRLKPLIG